MATTIHIPETILQRVDERAKALNVSRNRYILRALENSLAEETEWSADLGDYLRQPQDDDELGKAADEMMSHITTSRQSKGPPGL